MSVNNDYNKYDAVLSEFNTLINDKKNKDALILLERSGIYGPQVAKNLIKMYDLANCFLENNESELATRVSKLIPNNCFVRCSIKDKQQKSLIEKIIFSFRNFMKYLKGDVSML